MESQNTIVIEVKNPKELTHKERLKVHYSNDFYNFVFNWKRIVLKGLVILLHSLLVVLSFTYLNTLVEETFSVQILWISVIFFSFEVTMNLVKSKVPFVSFNIVAGKYK